QTAEECGQSEFPPLLSTPVEGLTHLRKFLQIALFCPCRDRCYAGRRAGDGRSRASVEHQIELSRENLWEEISGRLKAALSAGTYAKWFGDVHRLEIEDATLVLTVPSEFTRDWIEGHFLGLIGAAVRDIVGVERSLELRVAGEDDTSTEGRGGVETFVPMVQPVRGRPESGGFNAKYTFDSFVIGPSNRF